MNDLLSGRRGNLRRVLPCSEFVDRQSVLRLHPFAKSLGAELRRRGKFAVIGNYMVQDAPTLVEGRVDDGMVGPPVLGLHVESVVSHVNDGIKSGTHRSILLP